MPAKDGVRLDEVTFGFSSPLQKATKKCHLGIPLLILIYDSTEVTSALRQLNYVGQSFRMFIDMQELSPLATSSVILGTSSSTICLTEASPSYF